MGNWTSECLLCEYCIYHPDSRDPWYCAVPNPIDCPRVCYNEENMNKIKKQDKKKVFAKADTGKPGFELLPIWLMDDVNKVLRHGADKYGVLNWQKTEGFKLSRCYNALLRHMFAWWRGEDIDPESGISHLAHAMCNLLFLTYHFRYTKGCDDRPKENRDENRTY